LLIIIDALFHIYPLLAPNHRIKAPIFEDVQAKTPKKNSNKIISVEIEKINVSCPFLFSRTTLSMFSVALLPAGGRRRTNSDREESGLVTLVGARRGHIVSLTGKQEVK